jgi:signal transduction histidine kinase/DNA-binding NarL/FixJ family response regulator
MVSFLHKSSIITFLALFIFISGLSADLVRAQSSGTESVVILTAEEQAWLAEHPEIVLGAPTDYPPMVIKQADGTHIGVLVDLFAVVSRQLNTKVRLHIEDSWANIQEKAHNREIDGLAFGGRDPSRDAFYNATDIVMPTYFSVFGRSRSEYQIKSFSDLDGMRIGYKRAALPTRSLLAKLPSAVLKPYDSHESLTQALLDKEIDVIAAWMSFDHWRKEKLQGTIDNILLIDEYPIEMVTYIRNDWPELIPILNKTLVALQQDDLPRIINKWFGQWPQLSPINRVPLTSEERAWLDQKHTVRVRIANWPPYLIVKDDQPPQGIVIEYLKLIENGTKIEFKYEVSDQPFAEFLESMKQGQGPDMTAVIVPTPEREQYLSFSETYIASPYVIFTQERGNPILDISGLDGKTLAVPRGFVVQQQLDRDYPEIRQALYDSDEAALQAVATGQADAYIGNLTVASHIIHGRGFSHLRVAAASPFGEQALSMGNRKDWPELTSIINKALASITEEEKTAIRNKYLAIKFEQGINKAEVLKWVLIVGGSALGILLVFVFWNRQMSREISKRKQTELALKHAKDQAETANQAKSLFLANMSHELRTPLNAILGFSRMLAQKSNASADEKEKLSIINRSGLHLLSMINDVLDLSKIEAERIELQEDPLDLVGLIKEMSVMIQSRATEKGVSVAVEVESISVPYVKADMGKLRQILINLLNNAVKFTDEGGVTIRCDIEPIPQEPNRCLIVIEVEDTGPGIEPARQAQIFEPFVQASDVPARKGTGLGLSICKKYAEFMGGTIELESEVGKGSLFRMRLPAKIVQAVDVKTPVDDRPKVIGLAPTQKTWRILAADDNHENLLLLKSLLENVGFVVLEAKNGKEAVAAFKKESPDFVWMDMRMPVMDGYEAVRQIRQRSGGDTVPIIAITASAFSEQREEILAAGCNDMVIKPFQDHEIFEMMNRFLGIEYIYEPKSEAAAGRLRAVELTAAMLADLPDELLRALRQATLALNREDALEVIARIGDPAPEVAAGLKELVDNYQMVELRDLLAKSKTEHA